MKIVLVIEFLPQPKTKLGGVTVAVHRLANSLVKSGHEVVVVALTDGPKDSLYQVVKPSRSTRINRWLGTTLGLQFYPIILNFVNVPGVDIWHFHGYDHFLIGGKRLRLRTLHGSSLREMQASTNAFRKIVTGFNFLCEKLAARRADRVLCIGTETAAMYGSKHVVNNPFDPEIFKPSEKADHPTIFFNGYWSGRKRGWFLYERFIQDILPVYPDAELIMLCNDVPRHPSVKMVCGVTDEELAVLYSTSWLFCYPSIYEGFGMAYMEAMASGTAIVTSQNPGADYILDSGVFGVVADDQNFSSEILRLLGNSAERNQISLLGMNRCKLFTIESVTKEHLDHYEELLNEKVVGES